MRILQITDFHLDDLTNTNEHLRLKNYKEYLNELSELINSNIGTIDYIFATGDFVNRFKTQNFDHAKTILTYLSQKLNVTTDSICVCIGNHDFSQSLDSMDRRIEARKEFNSFSCNFSMNNIVKQNDYAILYKLKDIWCLSLDSTWGTGFSNKPRSLTSDEIDNIISDFISDIVPNTDILTILSHYPMIHFHRALMYIEENDWAEKHEWKDAYYIVERLYKIRRKQHTIYFFGDGHIPDFTSYDELNHFILSAMFGSGVGSTPNQIAREAKIVEIEPEKQPKIYTLQFKMRGYSDNPLIGDWKYSESQIRLDKGNSLVMSNSEKETEFITESKVSKTPIVISKSIQDKIINRIAIEGLYSLDRYATSDTKVSLSWIYTNRLLSDSNILSQITNRAFIWFIENIFKTDAKDKYAFIGVDYWGAIIASQVSIRTNVKSYCIASKAGANHHTYKESVNYLKYKKNDFIKVENIILFTDVIATGDTVCRKKNKIEDLLGKKIQNWFIVSIIADREQNRDSNLDEFKEIVTFCSDLRTPVLLINQIPDEVIVPPRLDLRVSKFIKT
ncbi:MAG: metallophosphoesterase [Bacteroidales bacterium]|nr:metallophosphoesterase [Bacteroidales bacterium]